MNRWSLEQFAQALADNPALRMSRLNDRQRSESAICPNPRTGSETPSQPPQGLNGAPQKPRKYRNEPVEVDGHRFDSKKEAARYGELKLMKQAGEIMDLELQRRFPLTVNDIKIAVYVADFHYYDTRSNEYITEDVKSPASKTRVYSIKRKLMRAIYGISILET